MIGTPIGTSMAGGEPNWSLAAVGGGLAFISMVPLNRRMNRKIKNVVEIYNSGLETSTSSNKNIVTIGFTTKGLGIIVKLR